MSSRDAENSATPMKRARKDDHGDVTTSETSTPKSRPKNDDYTIGWICAIDTEYLAAQMFLDDEHGDPDYVSPHDSNNYTLGRIGKHNVVIATLPDGDYGLVAAATVARNLLHSFRNVRIGLMVGIGGGAPSQNHDIRLGDVVVSSPRDGTTGVLQYDFGKTVQDQTFRRTGFQAPPPQILRGAVTRLRTQYERNGNRIDERIATVLRNERPRVQRKYKRPHPSTDRLYQCNVVHPSIGGGSCVESCGSDPSKLVLPPTRDEDEDTTVIHYGLIASANQLMKDASIRDSLAAEERVLCFEMEAAGLMNHFPCLVIRGICDYADSHKNNDWQGYAAMAAAVYAKDLLSKVLPNNVEAERAINDILSSLHGLAMEQLESTKQLTQTQKDLAKERLSKEGQEQRQKCHQLFRLTTDSRDATYEWYKNRVEERVDGTCMWFLAHPHFQSWLAQESGPLLVTADPGCGKSVLAKYLIDHGLPRSSTICYFFFKDNDQNTVRQALCAILHQLFCQKLSLIDHALPRFRKDGQGLVNSTESLWEILRAVTKDPQAGLVTVVLDALDECAESEFADLMWHVQNQSLDKQSNQGKLKYILTCRPYEQIVSQFHGLLCAFSNIRIPGEEESETISQEVNRVITHRIKNLPTKDQTNGKMHGFTPEIKGHLEKRLQETTQRTYLWVYLVFDYLEKQGFKKTTKGVDSAVAALPRSVNEAYEQILNRCKEHPMVTKALCIILAANRPLTLSEMNVAVNFDNTTRSIHDIDLEAEEDFKIRLRSSCGLFISIHHGKIYFLHQTAREFLLRDRVLPTTIPGEPRWRHSITTTQAHTVLAELCVLYLNFFNDDVGLPTSARGEANQFIDQYAFLDYAAKTWGSHFRESNSLDASDIIPFVLKICDPNSKSFMRWFRIYWQTTGMGTTENFTKLMVASFYGHRAMVKLLLREDTDVEVRDKEYGRTPLCWAAKNGHAEVVELLLEKGADDGVRDKEYGRTPLCWAAINRHESVIQLLLSHRGVDPSSTDNFGQTLLSWIVIHHLEPLLWTAQTGDRHMAELLLKKGANVETTTKLGYTPLSWAAKNGHPEVVQLLLENGADIEVKDGEFGRTPLSWAAQHGHEGVVRLLLENDADIEVREDGRAAFSWAAKRGQEAIVWLLDDGAGWTPLSWAAKNGCEAVVKLLLENGAAVDAKDRTNRTPLSWAAQHGYEGIVKLLLGKGAAVDVRDQDDLTPLLCAAQYGREAVVRLLLGNGADIETKYGPCGLTTLSWAIERGQEAVVRLLLENGANINAQDEAGLTPLSWAARHGREAIVRLLLGNDADIAATHGLCGLTPLPWAVELGQEAVMKPLVENGTDANATFGTSQTPLSYASYWTPLLVD